MASLGDLVRQHAGAAVAPPRAPDPTPAGGGTLGDLVRQHAAPSVPPELVGPPAPPAESPPAAGTQAGVVVGQALAPPPGEPPLREPTWGETIGLGAARVLPPIVAGAVTTPFLSPVGGLPAAALAGTLGDVVAQRYERSHGLRREVRPYQSIVSGAASAVPGTELAPAAGLAMRAAVRAAEGAGINTAATLAETGLEEHRLPTLGDVVRSAATGAAFGGVAGTAEHGVHAYVRGRGGTPEAAPADVAETPIPPAARTTAPSPEIPAAAQPLEPVRMVTQPGETIGGGGAPPPPDAGPAQYRVTAADGRAVVTTDPAVAVRVHESFGGHANGAVFETLAPETAPPPPGREPPLGPARPSEDVAGGPTVAAAAEPEAWAAKASPFRRVPGLGEARTGEPIPEAVARPPERRAGALERVDRTFAELPEASRTGLKAIVADNADAIETQVRGTQPMERTRMLARDLIFDPDIAKREPKGTTWNDQQLTAAGNHIAALDARLQDLRTAYEANPTPELAQELEKTAAQQATSLVLLTARTGEAGRALNATKLRAEQLSSGNPAFVRAAVKRGLRADQIVEIMQRTGPDDIEARTKMLVQFGDPRSPLQRLQHAAGTVYISNILSGVKPTEHNVIGNSIATGLKLAMTPPAAGIDVASVAARNAWARMRGRAPTAERTVFAHEVFKQIVPALTALPQAARKFTYIMAHGFTPEAGAKFDIPHELFPRAHPLLRGAANVIPRFMSAQDAFARVVNEQMEHSALAYTTARNQVSREAAAGALPAGQSVADRMADVVTQYHDHPTPAMLEQIQRSGARGVYQEANALAKTVTTLRDKAGLVGKVMVPFVQIGTNLVRRGAQFTPLGVVTPEFRGRAGARTARLAQAETLTGSVGMALLPWVMRALGGEITGHGPTDPAERDAWYREGHIPNSIMLRGHAVGFDQLGPLAFPLQLVGNYVDEVKDLEKHGAVPSEHLDALAGHVVQQTVKSIGDQTFFQGPKEFFQAMNDLDRYGWGYAASLTQGFVPASGMLRGIARAEDPTIRDPRSFPEAVKTIIPQVPGVPDAYTFASVPPKIGALGEPAQSEQIGGAAGRFLSPLPITRLHVDPVLHESARIGLKIALPGGKISGAPLARAEGTTLKIAKGHAVRTALEELYADPGYHALEKDDQLREAMRTVRSARAAVARTARGLVAEQQPLTRGALAP